MCVLTAALAPEQALKPHERRHEHKQPRAEDEMACRAPQGIYRRKLEPVLGEDLVQVRAEQSVEVTTDVHVEVDVARERELLRRQSPQPQLLQRCRHHPLPP